MIDDIAGQVETTDTINSTNNIAHSQDGTLTERREVHVERLDSCHSHTPRTKSNDHHSSEGVLCNSDQGSTVDTSTNKSGERVSDVTGSVSPSVLQAPSTAASAAAAAGCSRVKESSTRDGGCDALPSPPETSFEFQSHWKQLRNSRPLLVAYFKVGVHVHVLKAGHSGIDPTHFVIAYLYTHTCLWCLYWV